ncbi:MAG: hypothetical protein IT381_11890 [Deltaproteobacteria bacterium]|nr:hypothetical protein [Deltaproteobacteria bacterium]
MPVHILAAPDDPSTRVLSTPQASLASMPDGGTVVATIPGGYCALRD